MISKSTLSLVLSRIINGAQLLINDASLKNKLIGISFTIEGNKLRCYADFQNKEFSHKVDITDYLPDEFNFTKSVSVEFKDLIEKTKKKHGISTDF